LSLLLALEARQGLGDPDCDLRGWTYSRISPSQLGFLGEDSLVLELRENLSSARKRCED
jgi:hypothetical protein